MSLVILSFKKYQIPNYFKPIVFQTFKLQISKFLLYIHLAYLVIENRVWRLTNSKHMKGNMKC